MPTIGISVKKKKAFLSGGVRYIVRDNSDYVIDFTFDDEWANETVKTARFAFSDSYIDVPFTGNSVAVPVISTGRIVEVGVFAGDLRTTTGAPITLVPSIRSKNGAPVEPESSVYDHIVSLINSTHETELEIIAEYLSEKIDNPPQAASIGDVLTVEEVDENGKPTKWKPTKIEEPDMNGIVRYDRKQDLDPEQMLAARQNIGAYPGRVVPLFFDTAEGSKHDNDIVWLRAVGTIISPGNVVTTSNGETNEGMVFPAQVTSFRYYNDRYWETKLLDGDNTQWLVIVNVDGNYSGLNTIQRITLKNVIVSFYETDDGELVTDADWETVRDAYLAGDNVTARISINSIESMQCIAVTDQVIVFSLIYMAGSDSFAGYLLLYQKSGKVLLMKNDTDLLYKLPYCSLEEQEYDYDTQAIVRQNIGAVAMSDFALRQFDDLVKHYSGDFGVLTGFSKNGAPSEMGFPAIYFVGWGERSVYPITIYDANGVVWTGWNSQAKLSEFTRKN